MAGYTVRKGNTRFFTWELAQKDPKAVDKLAHITDISFTAPSTSENDVSDYDSKGAEYEPGQIDYGSVSLTFNLNEYEYAVLNKMFRNQDKFNWGCSSFNNNGKTTLAMRGQGYFSSVGPANMGLNNVIQVTAEIRVSGEITNDFVDPIGASGSIIDPEDIVVTGFGGVTTITEPGGTLAVAAVITPAEADQSYDLSLSEGQEYADLSPLTGLLMAKANGSVTVKAVSRAKNTVTGTLVVTITGQST